MRKGNKSAISVSQNKNSLSIAPYERNREDTIHLSTSLSLLVTSSGCVRFAQDLGLCPQLISERTLRRLLEKIQQGRGRGRGRGGDEMKNVTATAASYSTNSTSSPTFVSPSSMKPSSTSSTSALQFHKSGLGFCEFIELIATIAIESPEMKNKEIFPTDFSKVFIMYFVRFVLFIFL